MKKLNLFLLVAGFFVFSSCTERLEHNEEKSSGNVVINLSSVNAERGAVPGGYSSVDISKVEKWTLTFSLVPPFDKFPAEVRTINSKTGSVTIGVGQYDLFVEGSYTEPGDNGGVTYNLSGTCSGIVVEEGNQETVYVLVGPKKTTKGKGSFSAEMSFEKVALSTYYKKIGISSNDITDTTEISKRFKAELVSKKTGEIVYSTHSGGNLLVAVADSGDFYVTVKSDPTEKISSGYYYFRFYADFAPVNQNNLSAETTPDWKEVSIGDNLVEIGDGLSTSMECTSLSLPNDAETYYYYASEVDGSKENNGISLNAPGELYAVLDTIYNNPMVQNAAVYYTYKDSIRFDISKIGSGKTVEIICNKDPQAGGDTPRFTLKEDSSVLFNMYAESITLFSTGSAKSVKIKENINANSSTTISLEKGVYLDLTSLTTGESMTSVNLRLDVDDIEYYKNKPMVVSSVSFNEKLSFVSSDSSNFTYDIVEKSADSSYKYYYAEEPVSPIVYYSNKYSQYSSVVQYWIQYKENNTSDYYYNNNNFSLAAFCDDYNGGLYAFEFELDTNNKVPSSLTDSSGYELVHFVRKKTDKSTEFTLEKNNTGYIKQQIPASMCTDGSRLYFVNTAATISKKNGQELLLSSWDHWAYENAIVYSVDGNSGQSASEVQLNFDSVFTKVTAVYCQGKNKDLYIAGYKTNQNGSTKDSTYCIYKLANPQNYMNNCSIKAEKLTKVSELFTTSKDSSFIDWCTSKQATQNVYAFNAITDMAIIDNNLYVLKNSYYFANANNTKITSSLIRINNGQIDKTWSAVKYTNGYSVPFYVARKFIAVLPKKKKLLISENASSRYYTGDFSKDDLGIDSTTGSAYAFDGYDPNGSFMSETKFQSEADFIENVSSN